MRASPSPVKLFAEYGWRRIRSLCLAGAFLCIAGAMFPAMAQNFQPTSENVCDARSTLGHVNALLRQHKDTEARLLLQRVQKCPHLSQIAVFNIAWTYGRMRDFKTALQLFATVDPDVPDVQMHAYAIAFGQFQLGDYKASIHTLKALQAKQALDADCANLLAVTYAKLGQYQNAYMILRGQLEQHPKELYAYLNLITLLTDAGQFAEAQKVASAGVAAFPNNSEVLIVRGATETLLGKLDEARGDFEDAVKISPNKTDPRFFLALTDYKLNHYAAASADLKSAMQAGVVSADLEYLLAECMLKLDPTKPAEAVAELDKAIRLNADSVPARTLRGKLLLEEGNPRKAVADLEIAHRIDPTMRSAAYNLARAYFAVGKRKEAQALYQQMQTQTTDTVTELSNKRIKQVLSGGR